MWITDVCMCVIFYSPPHWVYQQDLESGISYSLRHEVAQHKHIDGDALKKLRLYVAVLAKVGVA